jgi:CxxC motif-containing protein (DUF1111 family)
VKNLSVMNKIIGITIFIILTVSACNKTIPKAPSKDELLDGPIEGLTSAQQAQFLAGDAAFTDEVFTSSKGLGPIFVSNTCASCHAGEGKGTLFTTLTRFGQTDSTGNHFLHLGGPQLQNRAIIGYTPEQIPVGATSSKFTAPANTGLGFISLVSDADILALADPLDANGDGISGVPCWNTIPNYVVPSANTILNNGKYLCRFGKKASTYDLLQQTVTAYNQDMGITSSFNAIDTHTGLAIEPEVSDKTIRNVVAYLFTLKAPVQRTPKKNEVVNGQTFFSQIGCADCHTETLKTGYSNYSGLSCKAFHPYSDLLLHDMGSGLDDGYTEGSAKTYEWRTPLLWGLGLSPSAQGNNYFLMHDGRAHSIEEAILMHGGEGTKSKTNFQNLSTTDKTDLLSFLKSL